MPRATFNDAVIAASERVERVEGNLYFPPDSVERQHLEASSTTSYCPWKGRAHYYHVVVDGQRLEDAAWYYPEPKPAASQIAGHVAFWKGVEVVE